MGWNDWKEAHPDRKRDADKRWKASPAGRASGLRASNKWAAANPEKVRAKNNKATVAWRAKNPGWRYKIGQLLAATKSRAKKQGLKFTIVATDLVLPEICPVFGTLLVYDGSEGPRSKNMPSVDRINNSEGYVPGNVAVISWGANELKRDASGDQLRMLAAYCTRNGV